MTQEVKIIVVSKETNKVLFTVPCGYMEADNLRDEVANSYRDCRVYVDYGGENV